MKFLVATGNVGKAREFREILGGADWLDLSSVGQIEAPEETGATFRANACLKAFSYATATRLWTLADDSGLAVDALDGKPGVHSARWAQMHDAGKGDADNNRLLLRQLNNVLDDARTARFVCALALADADGKIVLTTTDFVEGTILRAPRGDNGFGYDPLFHVTQLGRAMAELEPDQKHAISHRGKALRRLAP